MARDARTPHPFPPLPDPWPAMPAAVPWDAPVVGLNGLWLEIHCDACDRSVYYPLHLAAAMHGWNTPLRRLVERLACERCRRRPDRLALVDSASDGSQLRYGVPQGRLDLMTGGAG